LAPEQRSIELVEMSKDIAPHIMSLLIPKKMMLFLYLNIAAKSDFYLKPVRPLADEALTL